MKTQTQHARLSIADLLPLLLWLRVILYRNPPLSVHTCLREIASPRATRYAGRAHTVRRKDSRSAVFSPQLRSLAPPQPAWFVIRLENAVTALCVRRCECFVGHISIFFTYVALVTLEFLLLEVGAAITRRPNGACFVYVCTGQCGSPHRSQERQRHETILCQTPSELP
jgi:hypothetical protein